MDRSYKIRFDEVERFRVAKGLTQSQLINGICDPKTLGRWQSGEKAYVSNIAKLAERLAVQPAEIIEPLPMTEAIRVRIVTEIDLPTTSVTDPRVQAFLDALRIAIAATGTLSAVRIDQGSVIIDVDMLVHDCTLLQQMLENDELKSLKIKSIQTFTEGQLRNQQRLENTRRILDGSRAAIRKELETVFGIRTELEAVIGKFTESLETLPPEEAETIKREVGNRLKSLFPEFLK